MLASSRIQILYIPIRIPTMALDVSYFLQSHKKSFFLHFISQCFRETFAIFVSKLALIRNYFRNNSINAHLKNVKNAGTSQENENALQSHNLEFFSIKMFVCRLFFLHESQTHLTTYFFKLQSQC